MPKIQLNVSSDEVRPLLEDLAKEFGFMWGGSPNVSKFVEAIALGEIDLLPQLNPETTQALLEALACLRKQGQFRTVQALAKFLNKFELSEAAQLQLDQILDVGSSLHLINQISSLISQEQPFQLSYQDAAGRLWAYTVRYAEIALQEKRNYLFCWCEETEGNQDIPELQHNWTLRLDRIVDAGLMPIEGKWHSSLDTVEVEFHLLGALAHAYQQRPSDTQVQWTSVTPPVKQVIRRISNTFWFIREILPYGKDCIVRSPDVIRQNVREHLQAAFEQYE